MVVCLSTHSISNSDSSLFISTLIFANPSSISTSISISSSVSSSVSSSESANAIRNEVLGKVSSVEIKLEPG